MYSNHTDIDRISKNLDRISKNLISRDNPPQDLPGRYREGVFAKCPKCGRIISIRVCYGCRELMCEECLLEHQIGCDVIQRMKGKKTRKAVFDDFTGVTP